MHAQASLGKWQLARTEVELKYELPVCVYTLRHAIIIIKNIRYCVRDVSPEMSNPRSVLISPILGVVVSRFTELSRRFLS